LISLGLCISAGAQPAESAKKIKVKK